MPGYVPQSPEQFRSPVRRSTVARRVFAIARRGLFLAGLGLAPAPALADTVSFDATYAVSVGGFRVGTATAEGQIGRRDYSMTIDVRTSGFGRWFSDGSGNAKVEGRIRGERLTPTNFSLLAEEGDDRNRVNFAVSGNRVRDVKADPPLSKRPDRVPVVGSHLRGVLDPLSMLLVAVEGSGTIKGAQACNRTIPVFDGRTRFNVALRFKGTRIIKQVGYSGPVIDCIANYVPIAGHRQKEGTRPGSLRSPDIDVSYLPIGRTRVLAPISISLPMKFGRLGIEMKTHSLTGASASAAVQ